MADAAGSADLGGPASEKVTRAALIADVFRNPNLRRAELSFGLSVVAQTCWIAVFLVLLFEIAGPIGPGLFILIRQFIGALTAPGFAALAERWRRQHVLAAATMVRAAAGLLAVPIVTHHLPVIALYGIAALEGAAASAPNAIQAALLPWLAETPAQLVAANALSSMFEIGAILVGGGIDAVLLKIGSPADVLVTVTVLFGLAVVLLVAIRGVDTGVNSQSDWSFRSNFVAGMRYLRRTPDPRAVVLVLAIPTLLAGMAQTLSTSVAIRLLHLGQAGTPLLIAVVGAGGLVGGIASISLVAGRGLARYITFGILLVVIGGLAVAALPIVGVAVAALFLMGIGVAYQTVSGHTLLQRIVPSVDLGPTVGVTGLMAVGTVGIGAIVASGLVWLIGIRWALLAMGVVLLPVAALVFTRLRRVEASTAMLGVELDMVRGLDMFGPLSMAIKSQLARNLRPIEVTAGSDVVRRGELTGQFFIIESGEFDVIIDAQRVRSLESGDCFGEIALLSGSPRTATVRARVDGRVWLLEREDFLGAVVRNSDSLALAKELSARRMAHAG
jgi:Cyclic nucleotide-binding domain